MGFAIGEGGGAEVVPGGAEGEGIGDFESGWEVSGVEDNLHGVGSSGEGIESGGEHGATLGVGDEPEGGFGDDAEQSF